MTLIIVVLLIVIVIAGGFGFDRWRRDRHSIDEYGVAMNRLRDLVHRYGVDEDVESAGPTRPVRPSQEQSRLGQFQ